MYLLPGSGSGWNACAGVSSSPVIQRGHAWTLAGYEYDDGNGGKFVSVNMMMMLMLMLLADVNDEADVHDFYDVMLLLMMMVLYLQ